MLKFGGWEGAAEDVVDGVYVFILWVNITINEISGFLPWLAIILQNFKHQYLHDKFYWPWKNLVTKSFKTTLMSY